MAKHQADAPTREQTEFANNPFAKLARSSALAKPPTASPSPAAVPSRRPQTSPAPRLIMRHEAVGRSGKLVTVISGIPAALRDAVSARLREALGCGAEVNAEDVVLAGSLKERASEWFQKFGDLRKLAEEKSAPAVTARPETPPPPAPVATNASGTYRRNVRAGMRVGIVLKEDQPSGELTEGIVRDLLTNSEEHPHGIKVRLVSGLVGRVKVIYA